MKKFVLVAFTLSLLSGCTLIDMGPGKVTKRKLVGNWECTTNYTDHNFKTVNNLKLNQDGSLTNNSTVIEPIDKPFFVYEVSSTGSWLLNENRLSYTLTTKAVTPRHTAEAKDAIEKDLRYKDYEEKLFKKYSQRINKQNTINFVITSLKRDQNTGKDVLSLVQQTAQKSYNSNCVRK